MADRYRYQFYLAHPILIRHEVRQVELAIELQYPWLNLINPFYDGMENQHITQVDEGNRDPYDAEGLSWVVKEDINSILDSDGTIVILRSNIPTVGTVCEMMLAQQFGKLVYAVCDERWQDHPWIQYFSDKMFTELAYIPPYLTVNGAI